MSIKFSKTQLKIVNQHLKNNHFPSKLTKGGNYIVLTTNELYAMNSEEFVELCKEIIPNAIDLISGYFIEAPKDSYLAKMFKKSLIQQIQKTYVTLELKKLKEEYPSFFRRDH